MGHIKVEQLNNNKNYHEWEAISLSEVNTIKSLIKNRCEFDKFYETKLYETNNCFESNGVPQFHEIVEITYLDLERLIKNTKLSKQQRTIIEYLIRGYDEEWIGEKIGCTPMSVIDIFNTACEKIKTQNDYEWLEWLETSGKIKVEGAYKQCGKCKRWLKANENNFSPNSKGQYGLHSLCKNCR